MRFALLGLCVALTGCSMFMKSIEKPTAEVPDVSVSSAGFSGVTGELRLDVMNPNGFGVPLAGIDWELSVGGSRAVTGAVQLQQTIPARGVAPVVTSLSIAARDAIAVASALSGGARTYENPCAADVLDGGGTARSRDRAPGPLGIERHGSRWSARPRSLTT